MKAEEIFKERKLPKGVEIDSSLDNKYDNEPYFKEKLDRANEILKKHPIPKELLEQRKK